MHELSIAENIVETVQREMQARGIDRLSAIALRIGRMTDVDPEALRFGFEVITRETQLERVRLEIEPIAVAARCKTCKSQFEVLDMMFACPLCRSTSIELTHGLELDIAYLELPDDEHGSSDNVSDRGE